MESAPAYHLAGESQASWRRIIEFYEEMVERPQWGFLEPVLKLVRDFAASERAERFRAGKSVVTLMLSIASRRGPRSGEPFVSVVPQGSSGAFKVRHWDEVGGTVLEERICREAELAGDVDALLARLWDETRRQGGRPG